MRLARWLYLRALAVTLVVAVVSFWVQLPGLIGSRGIWPAADHMRAYHEAPGVGFFDEPTLAWLSASDGFLHFLCALCVALAVALALGFAPRLVLGLLWLSWLSLVQVGGPFLSFQWDIMLIETLFFSIFFAPAGWRPKLEAEAEPPGWSRFLVVLILFKVTFFSGVVKLASGDPSWRNLTALTYHYWTQPLPAWTSYVAHQWPVGVHQAMCLVMFVLELPVALMVFGPRPVRLIAAGGLFSLQAGLAVAGNYSYFNLLAAALTVALLDDAALAQLVPKTWKLPVLPPSPVARAPRWQRRLGWGFAGGVAFLGAALFLGRGSASSAPLQAVINVVYPFNTINSYGAFAWMTKTRPELVLEGSRDGLTWKAWEFEWKPGRLDVRPHFVAPWQPRLDWQLWFAALGEERKWEEAARRGVPPDACRVDQWLLSFQWRLLQGVPEVRGLLGEQPFGTEAPKFVRLTLWDYRFAPLEAKGLWWERSNPRPYCAVTLDAAGLLIPASL